MKPTLNDCTFPDLSPRYDKGLREAVAFILENFNVLGIIASGTIIRGNPSPTSDFDIYIFHEGNFRQRLQRFFNGIPAELFVNTLQTAKDYLVSEIKRGRPSTAHMVATGFLILDRHPTIKRLRNKAREVLQSNPNPTPTFLQQLRYGIATQFEDGLDMRDTDPNTAVMILSMAVHDILQYAFWQANQWIPRDKDLLVATAALNAQLGAWGRAFFAETDPSSKIEIALKIADSTIGTHGFFEWDSEPQSIEPSD